MYRKKATYFHDEKTIFYNFLKKIYRRLGKYWRINYFRAHLIIRFLTSFLFENINFYLKWRMIEFSEGVIPC